MFGASKEYERYVHLEKDYKTKDSFEIDIEATRMSANNNELYYYKTRRI